MLCMATLLRDYKSEVQDILVSDKQVRGGLCRVLCPLEAGWLVLKARKV